MGRQILVDSSVLICENGAVRSLGEQGGLPVQSPWRKVLFSVCFFLIATSCIGCFPVRRLTVASVGLLLEDVAKASAKQTDPAIVEQGSPAYLMLLDGLIEAYPTNRRILTAGAEAYYSYAAAFTNEKDPETLGRLYLKGKQYALRALTRYEEFTSVLARPFEELEAYVVNFSGKDVPALFWFASCWAGWISVTTESVEAVADLPRVVLLMERVIALDENYYYGGAHLFMGIYKSAKPKAYGGEPQAAQQHFERAVEISKGNYLMAYVYYAEHYAQKTFQKDLFVSLLEKVLEAPVDKVPELTLINTIAKTRAEKLLNQVDEIF